MTSSLHPQEESSGAPGKDAPYRPVFHWHEPRTRQRLRLAGFIFLAVVLHAAFFYVFKVVYPASTRSLPMPSRVVLLRGDDPNVRNILAEVEDRTAAYDPSLGTTVGNVALSTYRPSFVGHKPELIAPPVLVAQRLPLPDALEGSPLLPDPDRPPAPARESALQPPAAAQQPLFALGGAIASRGLRSPPRLEGLFTGDTNAVATFAIGVNASGVVQHCIPDEDFLANQEALLRALSQADQLEALRRTLCQMRFEPAPGAGLSWGFVTVEW